MGRGGIIDTSVSAPFGEVAFEALSPELSLDAKLRAMAAEGLRRSSATVLPDLNSLPQAGANSQRDKAFEVGQSIEAAAALMPQDGVNDISNWRDTAWPHSASPRYPVRIIPEFI